MVTDGNAQVSLEMAVEAKPMQAEMPPAYDNHGFKTGDTTA